MTSLRTLQRDAFRVLNTLAEPIAKSRWSGPHIVGPGLVLLETTGRKTGMIRQRPVLSFRVGDVIVAGTVRPSSDWIANLRARPKSSVWLDGEPVSTRGVVLPLPVGSVAALRRQ